MDREAWGAAVHGVEKSWTQLSDWTELTEEKPRSCPKAHYPLPLHPLPSLISNLWNSRKVREAGWSLFPRNNKQGTQKGFGPRIPTGSCLVSSSATILWHQLWHQFSNVCVFFKHITKQFSDFSWVCYNLILTLDLRVVSNSTGQGLSLIWLSSLISQGSCQPLIWVFPWASDPPAIGGKLQQQSPWIWLVGLNSSWKRNSLLTGLLVYYKQI